MTARDTFVALLERARFRVALRGDGGAFQCPCHDDKHAAADGRKISQDCETCHTIEENP